MGIKKVIAGMSMAVGAAVAPMATKANTETNEARETVRLSDAEKSIMRQEQLQAVIRTAINAGADLSIIREEAVKYIDFPSFIPVTRDGQFDGIKCAQWVNAFCSEENLPHIKEYLRSVKIKEFLKSAKNKIVKEVADYYTDEDNTGYTFYDYDTGDFAYKAFPPAQEDKIETAQIGIQPDKAYVKLAKNLAKGDKEKEKNLLDAYTLLQNAHVKIFEWTPLTAVTTGIAAIIACTGFMGGVCLTCAHNKEEREQLKFFLKIAMVMVGVIAATMAAITNSKAEQNAHLKSDLNKAFYTAYVVHTKGTLKIQKDNILAEDEVKRQEIIKRDAEIAAKTIEFYRKEQEK